MSARQDKYLKYLNVNTKFRPFVKGVQPSSTDFLVTLPIPIKNVLSMKLKTFNAPDNEYTFDVSEKNNSFEVFVNGNSTPTTVVVAPGKYNNPEPGSPSSSLLLDQVNSQLTPLGITMVFLPELKRYAFTGNNIRNVEINFDVAGKENNFIYNTFGWILGFQRSYYSNKAQYAYSYPNTKCIKTDSNVSGVVTVTGLASIGNSVYYLAEEPIQLPNTSAYYLLSINDFLNESNVYFYEACFPSNNIMDNIFARITTKYALDNNTYYDTDVIESYKREYAGPVTLSKLHIRLYDDNYNILEFNNTNYSFLLELEVKG